MIFRINKRLVGKGRENGHSIYLFIARKREEISPLNRLCPPIFQFRLPNKKNEVLIGRP